MRGALWCIYTFALIRRTAGSSYSVNTSILVGPSPERVSHPKGSQSKFFPFFFFHARSLREAPSSCRFQSVLRRPTEYGRIWGHCRAGRCGLIRRTLHFIKARNHTDVLPSGLAHYCDTTCPQSITQATDSSNLISTPWSHWFFPTDCIPMPLSAQEIYHVPPPPHNKQRLVQEVKWTHCGAFSCLINAAQVVPRHDMGTHAIFSLVRQCVNCSSRKNFFKKVAQELLTILIPLFFTFSGLFLTVQNIFCTYWIHFIK